MSFLGKPWGSVTWEGDDVSVYVAPPGSPFPPLGEMPGPEWTVVQGPDERQPEMDRIVRDLLEGQQ